jgi:hypothetical protein
MKNRMKHRKIPKIILGLTALFGGLATMPAAVMLEVDMDDIAPGIQSTRSSSAPFTATLWMTADALGVSSYSVSVLFDNTELMLDGSPAAIELLPAGFAFNFTLGVASESNGITPNSPAGSVKSFEAATFGPGPVSSLFPIGTIKFKVLSVVDDGSPDVGIGLFNTGVDGISDSVGGDLAPSAIYTAGRVVPEPGSIALLLAGTGALSLRRRHRTT